jgi:uroporphyrinogen-III synthase
VFSPNTAQILSEQLAGLRLDPVHFVCISENTAQNLRKITAKLSIAASPNRQSMISALEPLF